MSRRGRAPHQPAAGTRQERPPLRDNARPDPAAGLDMLLQLPLLRFSPPVKRERGASGKPPRGAGQPLAWPRWWEQGVVRCWCHFGLTVRLVAGFADEPMRPSPLEVTGREPHGPVLGVGRWWPCGDSVHTGLHAGAAVPVGEGFGDIVIARGTSHPGNTNPDGTRPPILSQTDVMLQRPQRPPLCCHGTTAARKRSVPTSATSQRGTPRLCWVSAL